MRHSERGLAADRVVGVAVGWQMAEESSEDRTWLLEPPAATGVHVHVEIGEGAELDESQRDALEALVRAFAVEHEGDEVAGLEFCTTKCWILAGWPNCMPEFKAGTTTYSCNIARSTEGGY